MVVNTIKIGFYKCLNCTNVVGKSQYFCKEHNLKHDDKHIRVVYDKKNYVCEKHKKNFIKFCFTDKINLCEECLKEHSNHRIQSYESMTPNIDKLKQSLEVMEENINNLKIIINSLKNDLDETLKIFKRYHYIAKDVVGKFELFNKDIKNHRILKSLWNLKTTNAKMNEELNMIINEKDLITKTNYIIYLFGKDKEKHEKNIKAKIDFDKEVDDWWNEIEKLKNSTKNEKKNNEGKGNTNI